MKEAKFALCMQTDKIKLLLISILASDMAKYFFYTGTFLFRDTYRKVL